VLLDSVTGVPKMPGIGPKYPVVDPAPDMGKVTGNFSAGDYFSWFGLTALSMPLGYMAGESLCGSREGHLVGKARRRAALMFMSPDQASLSGGPPCGCSGLLASSVVTCTPRRARGVG
jgi:hypothetical protein